MEAVWVPMDYETTGYDGRYEYQPGNGFLVKLNGRPTQDNLMLMKAALRPASERVISKHIGKLALHKRMVKVGEGGIGTILADYARHLAHLPEYSVILAVEEILRTNESDFFPQLATVLKIATREAEKLHAIYEQMKATLRNLEQIEAPVTAQQRLARQEQEKAAMEREIKLRWKNLPREQWQHDDWQNYINEPKPVAEAYARIGSVEKAQEWTDEAAKRQAEYDEAHPQELRNA